jgi:hypothetical protein
MNKRKIKKNQYPIYQFSKEHGLFAFMSPTDMYKIENVGSNSGNEGVTIDHYITRRMVIKHLRSIQMDIDRDQFREIYNRLFASIRMKIVGE